MPDTLRDRKVLLCLVFVCCTIVLSACSSSTTTVTSTNNPILSTESTPEKQATPTPIPTPKVDTEFYNTIRSDILQAITVETEEYSDWIVGVVIQDLENNEMIEINASDTFDAASIGKLPILMLTYDQVRAGLIDEESTIEINESNVERYGTGSIQYQKLPKSYTIKELARLMINVSDNTASSVLAAKVGRNNLSKYVKDIRMIQTNTKENDTVPYDTSVILKELYDQYKSGDKYAVQMVDFLTDTAFEDRIPRDLPKEISVAHKIGTQTGQFHDAGIVFYEPRPYSITVYNKNINNEDKAKDLIAKTSKIVYEAFNKKFPTK